MEVEREGVPVKDCKLGIRIFGKAALRESERERERVVDLSSGPVPLILINDIEGGYLY